MSKKSGPAPIYQSKTEQYEARKARQREKYRLKRVSERAVAFTSAFPTPSAYPVTTVPSRSALFHNEPVYRDEYLPLQIDDELAGLVYEGSPPPSPSLGSASMDISDTEPDIHDLDVPAEPLAEDEYAGFQDIDQLMPDADTNKLSAVNTLGIRLSDQLLKFPGCCRDCHSNAAETHANQYGTHRSLQSCVRESLHCPDILDSGRMAKREDHLASSMTAAEKRWAFSGIRPDDPSKAPEHICFREQETPCTTAKVTLDIDSIVGFCSSLGIAKKGIRWNFTQMRVSDLQSSLHLARRRVQFFDSHGHFHSIVKPVHKIPHYTFGRLVAFEDTSLYFLFPRLYREDQQTSRLLDNDFKLWTDGVLLPAIYRHYESSQVQNYPGSYDHGKHNSTARGIESRSHKVDIMPREQRIIHFLRRGPLHAVWETIQELIQQPGLEQFRDVTILLDIKNLKTLIKGSSWEELIATLQNHWGDAIDSAYMLPEFYFDLGKEICPEQTYLPSVHLGDSPCAEILLWKRCCLESFCSWYQDGEARNSCKETFYIAALLGDAATVGIEPFASSPLRSSGLVYSQCYNMVKGVFAAGDQYPFTNTAIETLALDPQLRKTWQHVGAALSHNPIALMKAYLHAKARCHFGLQASLQKSFGVREEHRVSTALFDAIGRRMTALGVHQQPIAAPTDNLPFVTHPTTTILSWFRWNINKFCVGFEMVSSLSQTRWVTWEHTRVMLMFLRCLRYAYGSGRLSESAGCWRDVQYKADSRDPDRLLRTEGLGFELTLAQYNYPWFLEKIDWETMTFKAPHGQYMLFNNPSMQLAYRARYGQVRDVQVDFISVNKIQRLMQQYEGYATCQTFLKDVLRQMCLSAFRKDVFQDIKRLLKKDCIADALTGKVSLCWPSLHRVLRSRYRPIRLVAGSRLAVQGLDVLFTWLWDWKDDQFQRKHWSDKPYRLLYQLSFEAIQAMQGKKAARQWKQQLRKSFVQSHWIIPYPQGDRFIKRDKQQPCWRAIYHPGVHAYYQSQGSPDELHQPFPASHLTHYPTSQWRLGKDGLQYMPYDIEPEHDLSDLSENEIYERVTQLAAREQLTSGSVEQGGLAAIDRVELAEIEMYTINPASESRDREGSVGTDVDRIGRARRQLAHARAICRELRTPKKRRLSVSSSEEESPDQVTSDEEQVGRLARRQRRAVRQKEQELEEVIWEFKRQKEEAEKGEEEEETHTDSIQEDSGVDMDDGTE